jgi:predicted  nucleic acid-binding Zn-ribbon protein
MMTVEPRRGVTPYKAREGAPVFLSDMIIELGLAEEAHVEAAVETARSAGETVGHVLIREGRLSEDQLARALAARYGLNHLDLNEFDVDPAAANLLPPAAAKRYRAVPVGFEASGSLLLAMADPSDSLALSDIAFMTRLEVMAAVAAENLIAELVAQLPLTPAEGGSSSYPVPAPAPPPLPPPAPVEPEPVFATAPPAPPVPDLSHELAAARAERDGARAELDSARAERDGARAELDSARAERDGARAELNAATAALDVERSKHAQSVAELRQQLSGEEGLREQVKQLQAELAAAHAEAARIAENAPQLADLDAAERRVSEAHATVEKMRNDFELEREHHATTERDLRGRLASETERHEALQEAQGALQKRVDALRAQNAALLDAYATAKRWSAEFARGARELANTLEQPVLDDAVRAQQPAPPSAEQQTPPAVPPAPPDDPRREGPSRFSRDDEDPSSGGGAVPPPDWLS